MAEGSRSQVEIHGTVVLGVGRVLEVLDVLVLEEAISENHGQMEDSAKRAKGLAHSDEFLGVVLKVYGARGRGATSLVMFKVETSTEIFSLLQKCTHLAWYPVLIPVRLVKTSFLAPRLINHWANSNPNPPRPPVIR